MEGISHKNKKNAIIAIEKYSQYDNLQKEVNILSGQFVKKIRKIPGVMVYNCVDTF